MDKKVLFNEALASLVEFASAKGNEITSDDVKLYFKDLIEDESQYKFIYDYLAINKIKVEGFVPTIDEAICEDAVSQDTIPEKTSALMESEEELSFIQMYMSELEAIPPVDDHDKSVLISRLLDGDTSVVDKLVECHLSLVAEIAGTYRGKGVTFGDLIQEGNIGLMLGLSEYHSDAGNFDIFIRNKITGAIEETVNAQINSDRIGRHLADKLNQLDTVTKNLSEKLGRVPEIQELAEAMGITKDEVSLLLKTSLDTLSVNEDTQITSENTSSEENNVPEKDPLQWRVNNK
ncbi:MAG: sigma-70 domain-containing protein [Eubacterium sp.]